MKYNSGRFKKGIIPWNKGKKGVYSKEALERMKLARIGKPGWAKGLTKETDKRLKIISEKNKGKSGWNKGLTKETDERVKRNTESIYKKYWSSISYRKKRSMKTKERWNNDKAYCEKMKRVMKEKWKDEDFRKRCLYTNKLKPTKPERELLKIIERNHLPFNYVGNGKIWFKGDNSHFNPDFLSQNPKYIIEVFGTYWHNREDMKKRDIERLATYQKYGFKTLIIWEHELIKSMKDFEPLSEQEIVSKINQFRK